MKKCIYYDIKMTRKVWDILGDSFLVANQLYIIGKRTEYIYQHILSFSNNGIKSTAVLFAEITSQIRSHFDTQTTIIQKSASSKKSHSPGRRIWSFSIKLHFKKIYGGGRILGLACRGFRQMVRHV